MTSVPNSVLIYYLKRQHKVINTYSVRFNQSSRHISVRIINCNPIHVIHCVLVKIPNYECFINPLSIYTPAIHRNQRDLFF